MAQLYNRVKFTTATTGTGAITVGAAVAGFRTPADASIPTGTTVSYVITDGDDWETGRGAYTAAGTSLARGVLQSSQSNAPLDLSGSAEAFITGLAEDFTGRVLISSQTANGSSGTITFTPIPGIYKNLILEFMARSDRAGQATENISIYLNGDTTEGNYRSQKLSAVGASVSGIGADTAIALSISGATAPAGSVGMGTYSIMEYAGTTFNKYVYVSTYMRYGATNHLIEFRFAEWENTAAVTRIDLITYNSSNFVSGSKFNLYGEN